MQFMLQVLVLSLVFITHTNAVENFSTGGFGSQSGEAGYSGGFARRTSVPEPEGSVSAGATNSGANISIWGTRKMAENAVGCVPIPIDPQFADLAGTLCVGMADSCECLARLAKTNVLFKTEAHGREGDIRRLGYQFFLEEWLRVYSSRVSTAKGDLPAQCQLKSMRSLINKKLADSSCQGDKEALRKAIDTTFGAASLELSELIKHHDSPDRFYDLESGEKDFIDCMEPPQKVGIALLLNRQEDHALFSAAGDSNESVLSGMIDRLTGMKNSILGIEGEPKRDLNNRRNMVSHPAGDSPFLVLNETFPGLDVLIKSQAEKSEEDMARTIDRLIAFLSKVKQTNPSDLFTPGERANQTIESVAEDARSMSAYIADGLSEVLSTPEGRTNMSGVCEALQSDMRDMICKPEDFSRSPGFNRESFAKAALRGELGTNPVPEDISKCYDTNFAANFDRPYYCRAYDLAQCRSGGKLVNTDDDASLVENFMQVRNRQLNGSSANSQGIAQIIRENERQSALRSRETKVVGALCKNFNSYVRSRCPNLTGPAYRSCATGVTADKGYQTFLASSNIRNDVVITLANKQWGYGAMGLNGRSSSSLTSSSVASLPVSDYASRKISPTAVDFRTSSMETTATLSAPTTTAPMAIQPRIETHQPVAVAAAVAAPQEVVRAPITSDADVAKLEKLNGQIEAARSQLSDLENRFQGETTRQMRAEMEEMREKMRLAEEEREEIQSRLAETQHHRNRRDTPESSEGSSAKREPASNGPGPRATIAAAGTPAAAVAAMAPSTALAPVNAQNLSNGADSTYRNEAGAITSLIREIRNSDPRNSARQAVLTALGSDYKLEDIGQVIIRLGQSATEESILAQLAQNQNNLKFDSSQRAMVEVWDENTQTARIVYVQKTGTTLALIPIKSDVLKPQVERVARLIKLKAILRGSTDYQARR